MASVMFYSLPATFFSLWRQLMVFQKLLILFLYMEALFFIGSDKMSVAVVHLEGCKPNMSSPLPLSCAEDWSNFDKARVIAATLVQSVYDMENSRSQNSSDGVPDNWTRFNLQHIKTLTDPENGEVIFGAVFEWKDKDAGGYTRPTLAPQIVLALRGTILNCDSIQGDICNDIRVLLNNLDEKNSCFQEALKAVEGYINDKEMWIVGHSLGASFGLLLGRKIALTMDKKLNLKAHLFNPPFVSPAGVIKDKVVNSVLHIARDILAGLLVNHPKLSENEETFMGLDKWVPMLYINPHDFICAAYKHYFDNQERLRKFGLEELENRAAQHCIRGMLHLFAGKEEKVAAHLIPTAMLFVNPKPEDWPNSHSLAQWLLLSISIEPIKYELLHVDTIFKRVEKKVGKKIRKKIASQAKKFCQNKRLE